MKTLSLTERTAFWTSMLHYFIYLLLAFLFSSPNLYMLEFNTSFFPPVYDAAIQSPPL